MESSPYFVSLNYRMINNELVISVWHMHSGMSSVHAGVNGSSTENYDSQFYRSKKLKIGAKMSKIRAKNVENQSKKRRK